jgi:predicted RNA-binding Zn-ribbon protein involved in translation (DUF1610 family)
MPTLQELKTKARRTDAVISCPECSFEEPFADFLDRDERVTVATETVHFGCPGCGSETVDLGRRADGSLTTVVNGIEEMEQLAGE